LLLYPREQIAGELAMAEDQEAVAAPAKSGGALGMAVNAAGIFCLTLAAVVLGGYINAALHPQQELVIGEDGQLTLKPVAAPPSDGASRVRPSGPAIYYGFDPPLVVGFEGAGRAAATITAVQQNAPLIRNDLMLLMSSLDYAEIMSREGKEALRARALEEVQAILERETGGKAVLESLLFTSFVVQ
jgi:hypothetical protein